MQIDDEDYDDEDYNDDDDDGDCNNDLFYSSPLQFLTKF